MRLESMNINNHQRRIRWSHRVVVIIPVLLGAAAQTLDAGLLVNTKADLQIAAGAIRRSHSWRDSSACRRCNRA